MGEVESATNAVFLGLLSERVWAWPVYQSGEDRVKSGTGVQGPILVGNKCGEERASLKILVLQLFQAKIPNEWFLMKQLSETILAC